MRRVIPLFVLDRHGVKQFAMRRLIGENFP
jgi:hypothetical protein